MVSYKESETHIKKKIIKCSKCKMTEHGKDWKLFIKSSYINVTVDSKNVSVELDTQV